MYEEAVNHFQSALSWDPLRAELWEVLGAAYYNLGRYTAALRAFSRAVQLDPSALRLYSLTQSGAIHVIMGAHAKSLEAYSAALTMQRDYPPALLGYANAALRSTCSHASAFGGISIQGLSRITPLSTNSYIAVSKWLPFAPLSASCDTSGDLMTGNNGALRRERKCCTWSVG